jgi:hypothetical protein
MRSKISRAAADRIQKKVSMPRDEFISEHRKLVKTLRSGSKATQRKEAASQAKELQ